MNGAMASRRPLRAIFILIVLAAAGFICGCATSGHQQPVHSQRSTPEAPQQRPPRLENSSEIRLVTDKPISGSPVAGEPLQTSGGPERGSAAEDADGLWSFRQRALSMEDTPDDASGWEHFPGLPANFAPWWNAHMEHQLRSASQPTRVDVESLVLGALAHSARIEAVRQVALIQETRIIEADAAFDWHAFLESTWDDISDPVGNTLTTGGSPRFRDHLWGTVAGVRKRTSRGGELEISQRLGFQDNNSNFFVPTQQGNAQFAISFTQPLLNGAGHTYNVSRTVLAQIDSEIAGDEVAGQLQDHLLKVTRAYWDLYHTKAVLLQKHRLYERGAEIVAVLEGRRNFDAIRSQLVRAQAAVASRRSALIRAELSVRNAETQLRSLVNDPQLLASGGIELLPVELPSSYYIPVSMRQSLLTALQHRPDITQRIKNVRATSLRLGMAENELLPALDLVMGTYVAGLEGDSEVGKAWGNQFTEGEPGYSLGLMFEVPLGNRRAKARHCRAQWEVQKSLHELQATAETAMGEVEAAVREAKASYQEMLSKYASMNAAQAEVDYVHQRWQLFPTADRAASLLLEDLLDAQERLAQEESDFVSAQVNYTFALMKVKRVTGTLLEYAESRNHEVPHGPEFLKQSAGEAITDAAVGPPFELTPN
jgi:outer membrane protein TolC